MKKILLFAGIAMFIASCNSNQTAERAETGEAQNVAEASGIQYDINHDNSELRWRGTKPTGEHVGTVGISAAEVTVDENRITGGTIIVDLTTIVNEDLESEDMNSRLVNHLKSEDFFHVEEHPEARFELVSMEEISATETGMTHNLTGNLTMRGNTKSVSFPARVNISDNRIDITTNEFAIDRTQWDVNFKSKKIFAELKDDFIHDDINLQFDVEFVR